MADTAIVRKWVLDANDGIISTTGIIQGFAGAGATDETVLFAAMTLMVTGGLSLGGAAYAEAAQDRAAELAVIEEEKRQLALSPEEERAELRDHYVERGLDADLADQVALQLMQKDPLGRSSKRSTGCWRGRRRRHTRGPSPCAPSSASSPALFRSRWPSSSSPTIGA